METDRTLIVVPTYNERENVGALIPQLLQIAPNADVMLVDDNSPDGTVVAAKQLFGNEPRFSSLSRKGPRGIGRSLFDGVHHMRLGDEEIFPAVVVVVKEVRAPARESQRRATQAGCVCHFAKTTVTIVAKQFITLIG